MSAIANAKTSQNDRDYTMQLATESKASSWVHSSKFDKGFRATTYRRSCATGVIFSKDNSVIKEKTGKRA
jgi:hypothetical protein